MAECYRQEYLKQDVNTKRESILVYMKKKNK